MTIANKVQLITYADSMGGTLARLEEALDTWFPNLFGGLHILPPFPSSGDRGFAPLDYFQIEPAFGTWADMEGLGRKYQLLVDVMVNHISRASAPFQHFLKHGRASEYADWFLTLDKLWPDGRPVQADLDKVYLRRPRPYSTYPIEAGGSESVWTTFGATDPSEQIDLDVNAPGVRQWYKEVFWFFAAHGIRLVRLDAVGYVIKKMGTSCFLVQPEFDHFLGWVREVAAEAGIELLCEVHAETGVQNALAAKGYWIYDFVLPYTVLHTLHMRDSTLLYHMLENRPHNQFTTLDCHDGVPVKPDLDGWVDAEDARRVCAACAERGAHFTRVVSEEHKGPGGFDVHQICGSYYDMLDGDDAYIAARAIQYFVPGIPQLYYVGLLAGHNDEARRAATGDDREANRHNFTQEEIAAASQKPVVQRLVQLTRLRNNHPAFDGTFTAQQGQPDVVDLRWENRDAHCSLHIDLQNMRSTVVCTDDNGSEKSVLL